MAKKGREYFAISMKPMDTTNYPELIQRSVLDILTEDSLMIPDTNWLQHLNHF